MVIMYLKVLFILSFFLLNSYAKELPSMESFEKYCFDCHADGVSKGDIDFDEIFKKKDSHKDWAKIWEVIEKEQMPPSNKKQPTDKLREDMMVAIEKTYFDIDRSKTYARPIGLYRLSNEQFANSIRDIFGYYESVSRQLPPDATSMGFNNIGSTMNISPLLFERYQQVALDVTRDMFKESSSNKSAKRSGDNWLKKLDDASPEKLKKLLEEVTLRAFRRPAHKEELDKLTNLFNTVNERTGSSRKAIMETFRAVIISPSHIFRTELHGVGKQMGDLIQLDEYALASRMSFFLWNSTPDSYLLKLASENKLREKLPEVVNRMVKASRFKNFSTSFGQQWLHIQYLENNIPNKRIFKFDRQLLPRMKRETSYFLNYLFTQNKPIDEIFTSKISFVDKELADHYGIKYPKKGNGRSYAQVTFSDDSHRMGILTHPSVLIGTSDPDRTSPVKRGLWLLESILGMPPPPAPANVPALEEAKKQNNSKKLSFKELLAIHRADKACASCHEMMDPLGLAMENFDAAGRWRTKEKGKKIEFNEEWRGHKFTNFKDLQNLIAKEYRHKFIKCLTEKIMIYALARGMEFDDRISIMKIVEELKRPEAKYQDILIAVIKSTPFQYRLNGGHDD